MVLKTISVSSDYKFESNIQGKDANGKYEGTSMFGIGTPYNRFVSMLTTIKEDHNQLVIDKLLGYYEGSYFTSGKKIVLDNIDFKKLRKSVSLKSRSIFIHFRIEDDTFIFRHLKININGKEYYFKSRNAHLKNVRGVSSYTINKYQTTVMFSKDDLREYMTFSLQFSVPDEIFQEGISSMKITEFRTSNNCKIILDIDKETVILPLSSKYELKYKSNIKSNVDIEYPAELYQNPTNYMRSIDLISPYVKFNKWFSLNMYISKDQTLASFIPSISFVYENVAETFSKLQNPDVANRIISLGCVYYYDDVVDKDGPFFIRYKNHPVLPIFSDHTIYVENRYKFFNAGTIPGDLADVIQQGNNIINDGAQGDNNAGDNIIDPNMDINNGATDAQGLTDEIQGNISLKGLIFPTELLLVQHDYDFGTDCIYHDRPDYIEYKIFDRSTWSQADFNEIYHSRSKIDEPIIADCEYPFIMWNEKDEYIKNTGEFAAKQTLNFNWKLNEKATESYLTLDNSISLKDQWTGTWIGFKYIKGRVAIVEQSMSEINLGSNFLIPVLEISTPKIISNTIDVDTSMDMIFQFSDYITINHSQSHAQTDWIISTSNDINNTNDQVISSIDDIYNLTSFTVNALGLESNSVFYLMVRYKSSNISSDWGIASFNTKYQILMPSEIIINEWNSPSNSISGITYMELPNGAEGFVTCDYVTKSIYIHDGKSANIITTISAPDDGMITGVTNDKNGNLISCNSSTNTIYVHDGVTDTITDSFNAPGTAISDITVDSSGNLISCDGDIQRFYIHDGISSTITADYEAPELNIRGITSFYGVLYLTSTTSDKIYGIDSTDYECNVIPMTEINAPSFYTTGLSHTSTTFLSVDLDSDLIYEHKTIIKG